MTAIATLEQTIPTGTWKADPTHSQVDFAVKHLGISTVRGTFSDVSSTLAGGEHPTLTGSIQLASVSTKDKDRDAHLSSPDFFDTERYPELRFVSSSIRRDGDQLVVEGDLTVKDQTHPVEARGTITDPHETLGGAIKIGLTLETIIDRTKFGLNWNAPLPKGGFAVADDVKLTVELELAQDGE